MRRNDVFIVGIGIRGVSEITPEVERILRRSTEIFYMDPRPLVSRYFNRINRRSNNLFDRYADSRKAYDVYEEVSTLVVERARKKPGVCYATYGNPMIYDTITDLILRKASSRHLKVEVLPSVSALDTVLTELKLPILNQGLQIFEANRLVLYTQKMDTSIPCLVFGLGSFAATLITLRRRNTARRFADLEKFLLRTYPPNHRISLVVSSLHPDMPSRINRTNLNRLAKMYSKINYNTTLYIPPLTKTGVIDRSFESKLHSARWLTKIVQ